MEVLLLLVVLAAVAAQEASGKQEAHRQMRLTVEWRRFQL